MNITFLTNPKELYAAPPGGVQLCSQEYLSVLEKLGAVDVVEILPSAHHYDRFRRKFFGSPYLVHNPKRASKKLKYIASTRPDAIFINHAALLRYAEPLKEQNPDTPIILLSHGNQSGDDLFECAHPRGHFARNRRNAAKVLGRSLIMESEYRMFHLDGVVTMSVEETVMERWLGCSHTFNFQRIIRPANTRRSPEAGKVGFVGTLNHTPNSIAIQRLASQLERLDFSGRIQLVGSPEQKGRQLASRYPFIQYLGALDDDALEAEMRTWQVALNPVFWLSRGASMKLKILLENAVPVLSTRSGARGYSLPEGTVLISDDNAQHFAKRLVQLMENNHEVDLVQEMLYSPKTGWTTESQVVEQLMEWLGNVQVK